MNRVRMRKLNRGTKSIIAYNASSYRYESNRLNEIEVQFYLEQNRKPIWKEVPLYEPYFAKADRIFHDDYEYDAWKRNESLGKKPGFITIRHINSMNEDVTGFNRVERDYYGDFIEDSSGRMTEEEILDEQEYWENNWQRHRRG